MGVVSAMLVGGVVMTVGGVVMTVVIMLYVYKLHGRRESPNQEEFTLAALPLIIAAALFLGVVLTGLVRAALRASS